MIELIGQLKARGLARIDPSHRWRGLLTRGLDPFRVAESRHFSARLRPRQRVGLFARSVSMVEIETSSYCNRACWFCPNSTHDRRSKKAFMEPRLYEQILADLAAIGYCQKVSFCRYNEPLASQGILDRIREAREAIPEALLHLNTNGDYLDRDFLDELYDAGLRSMNIQVYLGNKDAYDHRQIRSQMLAKTAALDLRHRITKNLPGQRLEARLSYRAMALRIYGRNFAETGCNRGGTVALNDQRTRTSPCASVFHHAYIDYNGSMVPCCNIRSDISEHAGNILGRLSADTSIFDLYGGAVAASWRRGLIGYEPKSGVCATCSFVTFPATRWRKRTQDKLVRLRDAMR